MKSSERKVSEQLEHCVGYYLEDELIYYFKIPEKPKLIDYMAFDAAMIQHEDKSISENFNYMDRRYFTSDCLYDSM